MIRPMDKIDRCDPDQTIYITDDDPTRIRLYNCLGFVLGRMEVLTPPNEQRNDVQSYQNDVRDFLSHLRCDHHPNKLETAEPGFALLFDDRAWHVAKHLWGEWYESKDYTNLRFVHELTTISGHYKSIPSYWTIDQTPDGKIERDKFIEKNFPQDPCVPSEQGSVSDCLEELRLNPAKLRQGELVARLKVAAEKRGINRDLSTESAQTHALP